MSDVGSVGDAARLSVQNQMFSGRREKGRYLIVVFFICLHPLLPLSVG